MTSHHYSLHTWRDLDPHISDGQVALSDVTGRTRRRLLAVRSERVRHRLTPVRRVSLHLEVQVRSARPARVPRDRDRLTLRHLVALVD